MDRKSTPKANNVSAGALRRQKRKLVNASKPVVFSKKEKHLRPTVNDVCGMERINEVVACDFQLSSFERYATAIVLKVNEEMGIIPDSAFNVGLVSLYLAKLYACYLIRASASRFDVNEYLGFGSYVVPGFVGVAFHMSVCIEDRANGGRLYVIDPDYATKLSAYVPTEGSDLAPITTGTNAGEQIFGTGAALTAASLTFNVATIISRYISSSFKNVVRVDEIADRTQSYSALVGNVLTAIKPVSPVSFHMTLNRANASFFPSTALADVADVKKFLTLCYWLQDLPYSPAATFNSLARMAKIEPFKVTFLDVVFSYSRWFEICFSLLKRASAISIAAASTSCWLQAGNTIPYLFAGFAARSSWVSRIDIGPDHIPCYVTKSMKAIKMFPGLISNGTLPTKVHSSLITPVFSFAQGYQFVCALQRNAAKTASAGGVIGRDNGMFGTVPGNFTFANSVPWPNTQKYNQLPLATLDALNAVIVGLGVYNNQTSVIPEPSDTCPCVCAHELSGDTVQYASTAGSDMSINWINLTRMSTPAVMGGYHCSCSIGAGFLDYSALSRWVHYSTSSVGDVSAPLVEAGYRDSAYENFAAGNQGKNPSDSMMKFFRDRVISSIPTEPVVIKPKDLKPLIQALNETGYLPVEIDPSILNNLSGEYSLPWLTAAIATAVAKYGPSVWNALARNRTIRVRNEL